jgi:omega-6 fatty acid desaturase (delta-12 desaturase)
VIAGCAVALLFVWGHDAAHGALFASGCWSEVLGTIAMLPSLNMYRLWPYGHNKVHHGFTSFSPIDWIWRPLTPDEYRARSRAWRFVYRLERHPATCGLQYLRRVWWPGMVRFRPDPKLRRTRGFRASKL